jgi:DNA-directed RNA polymerase subunit M/transcription elongation factor TFIIS
MQTPQDILSASYVSLVSDVVSIVAAVLAISLVRAIEAKQTFSRRRLCTNCGSALRSNDNFCGQCGKSVFEQKEDNETSGRLDHMETDKFQDTRPIVDATCSVCGHEWMGYWDVSFKDRQCPQCKERWRVV